MKPLHSTLALAVAIVTMQAAVASAQTTGTTNTSTRNFSGTTDAGGAAANAGSTLTQQSDLFSSGGESGIGVGQLGTGAGRFATSQLGNAPVAGGGQAGGNQAFNQSFNRLLQVQTLQQTNRLGRQFSGGTSSRAMIRPSLRLGFSAVTRPATAVNNSIGRRLQKLSGRLSQLTETRPAFAGVSVAVADGGTVVLTGSVDSASARRLAENLTRMEPGVRTVKNELQVAAK